MTGLGAAWVTVLKRATRAINSIKSHLIKVERVGPDNPHPVHRVQPQQDDQDHNNNST